MNIHSEGRIALVGVQPERVVMYESDDVVRVDYLEIKAAEQETALDSGPWFEQYADC